MDDLHAILMYEKISILAPNKVKGSWFQAPA